MTALGSLSLIPLPVFADTQPIRTQADSPPTAAQMSLARDFVARISAGFKRADAQLGTVTKSDTYNISGLPEGEVLLFQIRLGKKMKLDVPLMGKIKNRHVVLSFRDFVTALEFPIDFDPVTGNANGWYIRQNKTFKLDFANRTVQSDQGAFNLPAETSLEDDDLFFTPAQIEAWFDIELKADPAALDLYVASAMPLPIEERFARRNLKLQDNRQGPPTLPTAPENRQAVDFPFIDVATNSNYTRPGNGAPATNRHTASIRTTGDLAYGTLTTQSQLEKEDRLRSFRANYKRQSLEPELLGPLNARRYELGDLTTVRMPIGSSAQEQGVRVTNIHPVRNFIQPSTDITGTTFSGWDVELYRDNQLLSFQSVGDDGIYNFTDVSLFGSNNNFRVVAYGPQGEIQEEVLYIPVDSQRLAQGGSAYDVSLTRQNIQTYNKVDSRDPDKGTVRFNALYEQPVGKNTALSAGVETRQRDGDQRSTVHTGISTTLAGALLNLNTAVDNEGETAAELVARRDFNRHRLRNELEIYSDRYGVDQSTIDRETLQNAFSIEGPVPFAKHLNPYYNFTANYTETSGNDKFIGTNAGVNANWHGIGFSQNFDYRKNMLAVGPTEDSLHSLTSAIGLFHGNQVRLLTDYEIKPESNLDRVALGIQRRVTPQVEVGADLERRIDPDLTTASTYVNWDTGYGRLSPAISYNSDNDVVATLNTRFGIAREPLSGKVRMYDTPVASNGGVSAFVFLDKDGDGIFNNEDEGLPDIVVAAPQNGGREITDEHGYAFLKRMQPYRLTDVMVDRSTLQDPAWISGFEGASIIPREGYAESLQFPIHMSGELDGTVYALDENGTKLPLRSVTLTLYNVANGKTIDTVTESDGFYLFSQIPPGTYYLNVNAGSLRKNDVLQPLPQTIVIGYEGTMIYSNDVVLQQGRQNIPVSFISDASQITSDPDMLAGRTIILNAGSYKSRILAGLTWFKMKTEFPSLMKQAVLLEKPSDSYASPKTGEHTLRLALPTNNIATARRVCNKLLQKDINCSIEVITAPPQKLAAALN